MPGPKIKDFGKPFLFIRIYIIRSEFSSNCLEILEKMVKKVKKMDFFTLKRWFSGAQLCLHLNINVF